MGEVREGQTMQERQRAVLAATAQCARGWMGAARLLGNLRADEIGDACEWAIAEMARLQREVVNRNQRALDGDRATRNEATLLDHIQAAEAERNRLHAEVAQLREDNEKLRKESNSLRANRARLRRALLEHGSHDEDCHAHQHHDELAPVVSECDCGFSATLTPTGADHAR